MDPSGEALDSIGRGIETSGGVLELRRKDDGKPIGKIRMRNKSVS
jgi:hypothetical protein